MGQIHIQRDLHSPHEGLARTVRVYTPDEYDARPRRRFPVIYVHDGQNVFEHSPDAFFHTWCLDRALELLAGAGAIEPWIVVAVDNSGDGRIADYSPWRDASMTEAGRAPRYARFLVETLKPQIEERYRTRSGPQWTAVLGSSLGGLVSLYLGLTAPQVFGRIGALSPSVMWARRRLFQEWRRHTQHWTRIYLDAGSHESIERAGTVLDYGAATRDFHAHLRRLGYADWELRTVLEPRGVHDELSWRRRLPGALQWLLS